MSHVRLQTKTQKATKAKKTTSNDLTINYDTEMNALDVEQIENRRKQNFEDEANSLRLDKEDTQRSNFNTKYLRATLVLKYCGSFICFHCL